MINTKLVTRTANQADHTAIANLIYFEANVHRHLDWRSPLEWLGSQEYWVLELNNSIVGALACPPDPEGVAWLRLFTHSSVLSPAQAWNSLWEAAKARMADRGLVVAAITVADWFSQLLLESGFSNNQKIVVLEHKFTSFQQRSIPPNLVLRPMTDNDLVEVTAVDHSGFAPLWWNSQVALQSGFKQSGFAAVALLNGEMVGYQISTRNALGAHLARLAVKTDQQGLGIGYLLVQDLISQSRRAGLYRITVNTQADNRASLALYKRIGFAFTGEYYSVFEVQL